MKKFEVKLDLYKTTFYVVYGTKEEATKKYKSLNIYDHKNDKVGSFFDGQGFTMYKKGFAPFIWINSKNSKESLFPIIAHESFHATSFVLNNCGIDYIYDGDNEPYAYALEYLTSEIIKRIAK